jgi:hypothetical protein
VSRRCQRLPLRMPRNYSVFRCRTVFLQPLKIGDLSEWLKEHAWKVCIPQKGIEGSNPSVSADRHLKANTGKHFIVIIGVGEQKGEQIWSFSGAFLPYFRSAISLWLLTYRAGFLPGPFCLQSTIRLPVPVLMIPDCLLP